MSENTAQELTSDSTAAEALPGGGGTYDPQAPTSRKAKGKRPLAPKPSTNKVVPDASQWQKKQSKSRNGCATCKTKRMKCDETKPSCYQCTRRGITCPGYKKEIKWKPFGKPKEPDKRSSPTTQSSGYTDPISFESMQTPRPPREPHSDPIAEIEPEHQTFSNDDDVFNNADIRNLEAPESAGGNPSGLTPIHSPKFSDADMLLFDMDIASYNEQFSYLTDLMLPMDNISDFDGSGGAWVRPADLSPPYSNPPENQDHFPFYKQPQSQDDAELIAILFEQETCNILSIADEPQKSEWRMLIWPLAEQCPALYHALAGMTCSHMSKNQPQLRSQGISHVQTSMQLLAANMKNGSIRLDATIAAMLALGFADQWDHTKSSTGISHIRGAKVLVERALAMHQEEEFQPGDLKRLSFLANTWIYMDVIARITSYNEEPSDDLDLMAACSLLYPTSQLHIDPLMGYAGTLFPTIGRVADLVNRVRRRVAKRSSPAIISQAIELKRAVEEWVPPVDLESVEETTYNMIDAVQTAEAYRWATLLLLRQAVPELPSLFSWGDLAQKVLLYLATMPVKSRAALVQIFPLMVAGCEAIDQEDRDWVIDRWGQMGQRMITGIVDKCKEVTVEVWKRRDEYSAGCEYCHGPRVQTPSLSITHQGGAFTNWDPLFDLQIGASATSPSSSNSKLRCRCANQFRGGTTDFPDSAAFKKGEDFYTRAGHIDYTVKGDLHWLGVMKSWNWEIMLG